MDLYQSVCSLSHVDINVSLRAVPKPGAGGVYQVEAVLTRFEDVPGAAAKIVKKANAFFEAETLDLAQNGAVSKAAQLLGLGA